MNILYFLILISLVVATGFLMAFFWAVRHGQFEDDQTPAIRILFDDLGEKEQKSGSVNQNINPESNKK